MYEGSLTSANDFDNHPGGKILVEDPRSDPIVGRIRPPGNCNQHTSLLRRTKIYDDSDPKDTISTIRRSDCALPQNTDRVKSPPHAMNIPLQSLRVLLQRALAFPTAITNLSSICKTTLQRTSSLPSRPRSLFHAVHHSVHDLPGDLSSTLPAHNRHFALIRISAVDEHDMIFRKF